MQTENKMQTADQGLNKDFILQTGDKMQTEGKFQTANQV